MLNQYLRRPRDLLLGLVLAGFGLVAYVVASGYQAGTARAMGPGYFPTLLAYGLIIVSALLMVRAFVGSEEPLDHFAVKPAVTILTGLLLFGLLLRPAGLLVAIPVMVLVGKLADEKFSLMQSIAIGAVLALGCWLVFVYLLGQPIPVVGPALLSVFR